MSIRLTIKNKLFIAYALFLLPISFLCLQMINEKEANVAFAGKELQGLGYIAEIRNVLNTLARNGDPASLHAKVQANEATRGAGIKTAEAATVLLKALNAVDRAASLQAAQDLIGKAADGSNLTLDPDLDSFYVQDIVTVKLPTATLGMASLADTFKTTAGHVPSMAEQISIAVQIGAIQPALDGLAADLDSAIQGNPEKSVAPILSTPIAEAAATARRTLDLLKTNTDAANVRALILPALDGFASAGAAGTEVLGQLL